MQAAAGAEARPARALFGDERQHDHLGWVASSQPLPAPVCDRIVACGRRFPLSEPTTVGEDRHPAHRACDVRRIPRDAETAWLYELLLGFSVAAGDAYHGLALSGITREPHYVEYTPGRGHFHWHDDYSHEVCIAPRKVTVIVQLSEPNDYHGGDLEVFGIDVAVMPRTRGTVIVLPSFVPHRVVPVREGMRRALVSWIAGPRIR